MDSAKEEQVFQVYLKCAKTLILNLTEPTDRVMASSWLQKLRDQNFGSLKARTDYLKLLLLILQRRRLSGPFSDNPNNCEKLEEFPDCQQLQDVAKELLEIETAELGKNSRYPPYVIDYSPNMLQYAAAQDVPRFGAQVYFAMSKEPIGLWYYSQKGAVPRDKSIMSRPDLAIPDAEIGERPIRPIKRRSKRSKSRSIVTSQISFDDSEYDRLKVALECSKLVRKPVIWGSNLANISCPPARLPIPKKYCPEKLSCPRLEGLMEETCAEDLPGPPIDCIPEPSCSTEVLYERPGSAPCPMSCPRKERPSSCPKHDNKKCPPRRPSTQECPSTSTERRGVCGERPRPSTQGCLSKKPSCDEQNKCSGGTFRESLEKYFPKLSTRVGKIPTCPFECPLASFPPMRRSISLESLTTPSHQMETSLSGSVHESNVNVPNRAGSSSQSPKPTDDDSFVFSHWN